MSSYKLIAFDMDGTLLNSSKTISKKTLEMVNTALDMGKHVVLSTGRGIAELREYFDLVPKLRYVIATSGAIVYDIREHKAIYSNAISSDEVRIIIKEALKRDVMVHFLTEEESIIEKERGSRIVDYGMGPYQEMYDRVARRVDDIETFFEEYNLPVPKINLYHKTFEESALLKAELEAIRDKGFLNLELVYSEKTSLECSKTGTTKGTGLNRLCDYLGIDIKDTIAVGDADNDIDILSRAGLSVAMGNAKDNVKSIADVIVSDNDHDGCAEVIQNYLI